MKTALIIIFLVISVILAVIVMMQEGKGGLSGAISGGGADTYWSKNKGKSKESVLKKVTVVLGVLYFVGRKMQAKQEDQRAQLDQMAQTVNMLVIDKKRMKIMEAGFPKMVTDNIPKRAKMSKVPVVKAKVGPKITPLLCDEAIFDDVPVKAEIKAVVSGIYITSIKNLRNVAPPEPEKRGLRAKLTKKSAEYMRKN